MAWQRGLMRGLGGTPYPPESVPTAMPAGPHTPLESGNPLDGVWSRVELPGPMPRSGASVVHDSHRDRLLVFGGNDLARRSNETWSLNLDGPPTWARLEPDGPLPEGRDRCAAIYDPPRDRMVIFGGYTYQAFLNDVWALTLSGQPAWTRLEPRGTPPSPRISPAASYDPIKERMLLFGGEEGSGRQNDVWALSLGPDPEWSLVLPPTVAPAARTAPAAAYDSKRDRVLLVGGYAGGYAFLSDTWIFSSFGRPEWSRMTPTGEPPPGRREHSITYLPEHDTVILFGGMGQSFDALYNDTWELSLQEPPQWARLHPDGTWPAPRTGHSAVLDPVRGSIVVFGGWNGTTARNDTWELQFEGGRSRWARRATLGQPTGRAFHTAVYDPRRRRVIVFGGWTGAAFLNDAWQLDLTTGYWNLLQTSSPKPAPRNGATAFYDPDGDRMVVFGGNDGTQLFNDAWALPLAGAPVWSRLAFPGDPPSPRFMCGGLYLPSTQELLVLHGFGGGGEAWLLAPRAGWRRVWPRRDRISPRAGHSMAYDHTRDRLIVFGGLGGWESGASFLGDTWQLSTNGDPAWSELLPDGPLPSPRNAHSAIYDAAADRVVVFGGDNGPDLLNDVWTLDLAAGPRWEEAPTAEPLPRARRYHASAYDGPRERMIVFGGTTGSVSPAGDTWALDLLGGKSWTLVAAPVEAPEPSYGPLIHDPSRQRMVLLPGGASWSEVWTLSMDAGPKWERVPTSGQPPGRRFGHSAIHDPVSDRVVVFGGEGPTGMDDPSWDWFNDVWALDLGQGGVWTQLHPAGSPPAPRSRHAAAYDPVRHRMIVFGGDRDDMVLRPGVWELSLGTAPEWRLIVTAQHESFLRTRHLALYDPRRDRLIVWGGMDERYGLRNDTWALDLGNPEAWVPLAPTDPAPAPRGFAAGILDPLRDRMVVAGGYADAEPLNDIWDLSLGEDPGWRRLLPAGPAPPAMGSASAAYDPVNDRMVMRGGGSADTWLLQWGSPTPVLAALVSIRAEPGKVSIVWDLSGSRPERAALQRCAGPEGWLDHGSLRLDGMNRATAEDLAVEPGRRYGYRLALTLGGRTSFAGETWVDVPAAAALALEAPRPNPAEGELVVSFSLPNSRPASLEVMDLTGRRVLWRDLGTAGPGRHVLRLDGAARWPAGVYVLRLTHDGKHAHRKLVVVR